MHGPIKNNTGAARPTTMAALSAAESLVVWAFRRWAVGLNRNAGEHWSLVWSEFTRTLGAGDARKAMASFIGLFRALQSGGRRTVHHHEPCCPCLGADELWLICLVGACQRGELRLARALAEWMVADDCAGGLIDAGRDLGLVFERHALALPARCETGRPDAAMRALADPGGVVH